ncbi:MAG TPA: ATP-binding protein [Bryobacteraceae bacterium]|nr:ATP-binding protein [Bryobacteraceae bacterium]
MPNLFQEIASLPTFADQPQEHLQWLVSKMTTTEHQAGEIIAAKSEEADRMVIVLEGEIQARLDDDGADTRVFTVGQGQITGLLPYSRMTTFPANIRATRDTRLANLHKQYFDEMLDRMPGVGARLVSTMVDRARETTTQAVQRERLMAIGKLAAGLTHELNNPAAAARRAADKIKEALVCLRSADRKLASHELSPAQYCAIAEVEEQLARQTSEHSELDALERSDREQTIGEFLDDRGVDDAWNLAGSLVDSDFTQEHLDALSAALPEKVLGPALSRLNASVTLARLASEIEESTKRISVLVKDMKDYSYMDRTPQQEVDVHKSLETTLRLMRHELKYGIKVEKEFDPKLPSIQAFGNELNQVWTNLIDNAIDAMNGKGTLTIRTCHEPDGIAVEIIDDGSGIPDDIKTRIFDPFFTTKKMGAGTGLGLDIVRRIVNKHHGVIDVQSKPGETRFRVWLPVRLAAPSKSASVSSEIQD